MIRNTAARRMRFTPLALTTVLLSAGLLSLSVTGTLSGFTAAITNSVNSAASGTLTMQETGPNAAGTSVTCNSTDGGSVSTNTATCATINKFGGSTTLVPTTSANAMVQTVTIKNTGTVAANTFTLAPGATCTQSNNGAVNGSATDFCSKMNLTITQNGTSLFTGTLATFAGSATKTLTTLSAGSTSTFVFSVYLDSTAGNTYQGLQAAVPMTWTFNS
jgi:hypothetical protein